ncbi:MAG TPA: HAMP domain-containing sensor histidine kinase, partial [Polyangiaceae bacterium]|nr:HAMP domain-containing sensor histidine kinase [Polyangiaceae bacterium]
VALLEHWHGQHNDTWESTASDAMQAANTLGTDNEDDGRAHLHDVVITWVSRLREVIARGEGPAALEEMRARQGRVDEWANRVIDADVRAAERFDRLHGEVLVRWRIEEGIAASLLVCMALVTAWWRLRVRAATTHLEQTLRENERTARSQFFTNMSHELRTPLVSIGGFASMIEDNPTTTPDVRSYAEKINHVSRELLAIINNILDVAKLESEHMKFFIEPVSIQEVLERCITRAEGLVGHKPVTLGLRIEPGLPRVRGDFVKLQQVFTNIIGNAVKFTEKGEIVTRARAVGKNVVIDVRDTGIGIDPQALQTIWEPFRQVDHKVSRKFGGSGLGLAIVHAVISRLDGNVSVRSTVGVGTTFRVILPIADPSLKSERSITSA